MKEIIVDAGPFIHLNQINKVNLLKKFPSLHTAFSVISEIKPQDEPLIQEIYGWANLKITHSQEKFIPKIEEVIKSFKLHPGERDVIYIANKLSPAIILTDDLGARNACEKLGIEVHGSISVIAYAFHNKWLSLQQAEKSMILLYKTSSFFITYEIIEKAIRNLRKNS